MRLLKHCLTCILHLLTGKIVKVMVVGKSQVQCGRVGRVIFKRTLEVQI